MRKISYLLTLLLMLTPLTETLGRAQNTGKQATTVEHLRTRIEMLLFRSKACATIIFFFSSRRRHTSFSRDLEFRRVLFRSRVFAFADPIRRGSGRRRRTRGSGR